MNGLHQLIYTRGRRKCVACLPGKRRWVPATWSWADLLLCDDHLKKVEMTITLEGADELRRLRERNVNLKRRVEEMERQVTEYLGPKGLATIRDYEAECRLQEANESIRERREQNRLEATTWTYYARAAGTGNIKIGRSIDPLGRIKALNGGVEGGYHIRLVAIEEGNVERTRHLEFAHLRLGGEWFKPGPDLLEHISSFWGSLRRFKPFQELGSAVQYLELDADDFDADQACLFGLVGLGADA